MSAKVLISTRRLILTRRGFSFWHAGPDGMPVLRGQACWRNISGVVLNTPWGAIGVEFRRAIIYRGRRIEWL